jgi:hypothetical protein
MLASLLMDVARGDKAPRTLVRWRAREQAREPELSHLGFATLLGLTRAQAHRVQPPLA